MALVTPYLFPNQICYNEPPPGGPINGYLPVTLSEAMEIMWRHGRLRVFGGGTFINIAPFVEDGVFYDQNRIWTDNFNFVIGEKRIMRNLLCTSLSGGVSGTFISNWVSGDRSGSGPVDISVRWASPVYDGPTVNWNAEVLFTAGTVPFNGPDIVGSCFFLGFNLPLYADSIVCPNYSFSVVPEEFNDPD